MIRILAARTSELRVVGQAPEPWTVPHKPSAVSRELLQRFARPAKEIGQRWGVVAASSLLAHLEPSSVADDFVIGVRVHGPIGWVFSGEGLMRPFLPTTWFAVDETWQALLMEDGVALEITAAPDACLADPDAVAEATTARIYRSPAALLASHPGAEPSLQALAVPPRAEGRTIVGLAWHQGCVGPLVVDVDTGDVTLDARLREPWKPIAME